VGPKTGLDRCGIYHPPPGFNPRTVQPVASRYKQLGFAGPQYINKVVHICLLYFLFAAATSHWTMASSFTRFLDHTQQRTTLLWTSDQPVAETSTRQHKTLTTDIHALGGTRTHNLGRSSGRRPTPLDCVSSGIGMQLFT
jgi:hypothetical protein